MASAKKLNGVCHNIAHHAVSGVSWIHPYIAKACKAAGVDSVQLDLQRVDPYPDRIPLIEPLRLALLGLKKRFEEMLESEGFVVEDVKEMVLRFDFPAYLPDEYCSICRASLVSTNGKSFVHTVDYLGRSQE
jgi:hypothetical protein